MVSILAVFFNGCGKSHNPEATLKFKNLSKSIAENDITEIRKLLEAGAKVNAYDPVAMEEAKHHFGETISYFEDQHEALIQADCLAILTEWPEFKFPNFKIVSKLLNYPAVFDGRNIYDKDEMKRNGFDYFCIGVNTRTTNTAIPTKLNAGIEIQLINN